MEKSIFSNFFFALALVISGNVFAQNTKSIVQEADLFYESGKYDTCIKLLKPIAKYDSTHYEDKQSANRLLAMSYLATDNILLADSSIIELLSLNEDYQVTSFDPERFKLRLLFQRQIMRAGLINSVSKKNEKIELVPATIQIITAEDIQQRGYQLLEEIFYDLPGYDISRSFGITYSTLNQRGYRNEAGTSRTLLLVDGVQDNDLWTNIAFLSAQFPLSNVKRVEVIYGPASTIYGANAFLGVINIVTNDESDLFTPNANSTALNFASKFQVVNGSYNTKFFDATAAIRKKDFTLSVTGRIYFSDRFDLSKGSFWDGKWLNDTTGYRNALTKTYTTGDTNINKFFVNDPTKIYWDTIHTGNKYTFVPTQAAILRAYNLDTIGFYHSEKFPDANKYYSPAKDYYLSSKLSIGQNFKLGFEYFNRFEGSGGDYIKYYNSQNFSYAQRMDRQFFTYVKYDKKLGDKIAFSSLNYFRAGDYGDATKNCGFYSYGFGSLSLVNLTDPSPTVYSSYYRKLNFSQQENQFHTEFRIQIRLPRDFDLMIGTETQLGMSQNKYARVRDDSSALLYGHPSSGSSVSTSTSSLNNNFVYYAGGLFTQLSYTNTKEHFNASAGYRIDSKLQKKDYVYKNQVNPRVAFIYYPGNFIFKAIYSEAFLDKSDFIRGKNTSGTVVYGPTLQQEKLKNIELTSRYEIGEHKSNIELAAYHAVYLTLPESGDTIGKSDSMKLNLLAKFKISGLQIASQYFLNENISFYGNFSITNPHIFIPIDFAFSAYTVYRIGDIAKFNFNIGGNILLLKKRLDFNLRANFVADRPTGKFTSVPGNTLDVIKGYSLFNSAISYKLPNPFSNFSLQFICNNLLNTYYEDPGIRSARPTEYPSFIPQPGRNFAIRLTGNFGK